MQQSKSRYWLLLCLFIPLLSFIPGQQKNILPTTFKNNLIILNVPTNTGDTLFFYTDTGGVNYLYPSGNKKLNTKRRRGNVWQKLGLDILFTENDIPFPAVETMRALKFDDKPYDGMLGREWFAEKVWHFDYKNASLSVNVTERKMEKSTDSLPIYFRKAKSGKNETNIPRVELIVDGDTLSFLLDTGAMTKPSNSASEILKKKGDVAISFICDSVFTIWQNRHPDWMIIENGDIAYLPGYDIIIVPLVSFGSNRVVENVAFARRGDLNFKGLSRNIMDKHTVGAIGGNALSQLGEFTLDYQKETLFLY